MTISPKSLPTPEELERQLTHFVNVTLLGGGDAVDRDTRLFEVGEVCGVVHMPVGVHVRPAHGDVHRVPHGRHPAVRLPGAPKAPGSRRNQSRVSLR